MGVGVGKDSVFFKGLPTGSLRTQNRLLFVLSSSFYLEVVTRVGGELGNECDWGTLCDIPKSSIKILCCKNTQVREMPSSVDTGTHHHTS